MDVPLLDISAWQPGGRTPAARDVVEQVRRACTGHGFFCVVGHGMEPSLRQELLDAAAAFFALPEERKSAIAMRRGGRAWRGWFPAGGELTSGLPDGKEGVYFGTDLASSDPRVVAGLPLHGPNLYPAEPSSLATLVPRWIEEVTELGRRVLGVLAEGLGPAGPELLSWCEDPMVLFRIFSYPPAGTVPDAAWGVAEHTDYGLLTLLAHDGSPGLEVHSGGEWTPVPTEPEAIVCNLGDMVERVTGGLYRSTPHRVRPGPAPRISMPLFLDPSWDAVVRPLLAPGGVTGGTDRWDGLDVVGGREPYGDYLTAKVSRVFPELWNDICSSHHNDQGVHWTRGSGPRR